MEYIAPTDATSGKVIIIAQVSTEISSKVYIKIKSVLFINTSLAWVNSHVERDRDEFIKSVESDHWTTKDFLSKKELIALVFTRLE